jgi:hypothetical protein
MKGGKRAASVRTEAEAASRFCPDETERFARVETIDRSFCMKSRAANLGVHRGLNF